MSEPEELHPKGVVLIVDNDLPSLRTLLALLREEGYEVRGAPDGHTALMIVKNDPPDLILLDVRIGEMDGFSVCRQIKENEQHQDLPILFLSGLDEPQDKIKGFEAGAEDFITKPFQAEEVLARVATHLTLSMLRRDLHQRVEQRTAELHQVLERTRDSESRFRHLADNVPTIFTQCDSDRIYRYSNLRHQKVVGRTLEEIVGCSPEEVLGEETAAALKPFNDRALSGEEVRWEFQLTAPSGPTGWYMGTCTPDFADDGSVQGWFGFTVDITHLKEAEKVLNESLAENERLRERLQAENLYLRDESRQLRHHDDIVGDSDSINAVLREVEQVASTDSTVLILGETGTGKELFAEHIHRLSDRGPRQVITVNCAALPTALVESEFFGREKGAYTGAMTRQVGRFELADNSTLFLDEVGDLPAETQVKLLRVLQSGEFERLGSTRTIKVDVRVIAATNRDLNKAVREGKFREDLYYRLAVFPITVPPLRDRSDDIPLLVWEFVAEFAKRQGKRIDSIPRRSMDVLQAYQWPGNVRELRNVIERAVILSTGPSLNVLLPDEAPTAAAFQPITMADAQRRHIQGILERTRGRIRGPGGAAEILGMKPSTLYDRMKKLSIERPKI
jgi:PAS domain S-box-containing protein